MSSAGAPSRGTPVAVRIDDATGNVAAQTDAKGQTLSLYYDNLNRLTRKVFPNAEAYTWVYDEAGHGKGIGRPTTVGYPAGSESLSYDFAGRVTAQQLTYDPVGNIATNSLVGTYGYAAPASTCGHGVVGGAEQCDGGACCNANCTLKTAGTVCRAATAGGCDSAEVCSGASPVCPTDVKATDGTACTGGTCAGGVCQTTATIYAIADAHVLQDHPAANYDTRCGDAGTRPGRGKRILRGT
jgi:YD repeat-containing protein